MTFGVFPVWDYYEESGNERLCLHKLYLFISLVVISRNGIVGLDGKCIFNFMRNQLFSKAVVPFCIFFF